MSRRRRREEEEEVKEVEVEQQQRREKGGAGAPRERGRPARCPDVSQRTRRRSSEKQRDRGERGNRERLGALGSVVSCR